MSKENQFSPFIDKWNKGCDLEIDLTTKNPIERSIRFLNYMN